MRVRSGGKGGGEGGGGEGGGGEGGEGGGGAGQAKKPVRVVAQEQTVPPSR